jgi:hypothetical protein
MIQSIRYAAEYVEEVSSTLDIDAPIHFTQSEDLFRHLIIFKFFCNLFKLDATEQIPSGPVGRISTSCSRVYWGLNELARLESVEFIVQSQSLLIVHDPTSKVRSEMKS